MSFRNEALDQHQSLVDRLSFVGQESSLDRGYVFLADGESEEQVLSLHALDRRARALAVRLRQLDACGQRTLLVYPSGLEFLVGFFGALYAGAVAIPTYYPRLNALDPRLKAILSDSGATLALTTSSVLANLDRTLADAPEMRQLHWLASDRVAEAAAEEWRRPEHDAGTLAMLQYTSGSTGSPRGVVISHGNLIHNLHCIQRTFGLYHDGWGVSWLPAFHDMGLIGNLLAPIQYEGRVAFMSPAAFVQHPARWLRAVSRFRAYISGGPTFAYDLCTRRISAEERAGLDLSGWEVAYVGAEPISAPVLERFAEMYEPCGFRRESFQPCYGLAEATLLVSGSRERSRPTVVSFRRADLEEHRAIPVAEGDAGAVLVGCGLPMPDEDIRIVDPATRQLCDPGQVGEVWVAGPSVAGGYWQQPEATEQTFHGRLADRMDAAGPYLRTGDLAFLHEGELFITGRIKDAIIVRGRNYYPQDIESAVETAHPALRPGGGVAFAVRNGDEEQVVIVHERDRRHRDTDPAEVFDAVRRVVAERLELEVSAVLLIKPMTLPRTTSGKVRRSETRSQYLIGQLNAVACWERPATESQDSAASGTAVARAPEEVRAWLVDRLARHLRLPEERVDVRRPFAAYGLDSVTMVSISAELQTWIGQTLPPTLLYDAPTIEALAERLTGGGPQRIGSGPTTAREPIAVVGIGCRFPGAESPRAFWQLLCEGRHAITDLPEGRWYRVPENLATTRGGYLREVDRFDALFFGISPREAVSLDPQHRLLLETTWEALEDAGHAPESLEGTRVGVFVGVSNNEYVRLLLAGCGATDAYGGTGTAGSMAANRLSYHFDFRGPSLSIDTACSSSLVALHQACRSLRDGECELAVAAGVNLILAPEATQTFSLAGMLAPDGLCKTFDASADGYVRGEGCGVVVLKPLSAALRDRDRVLAVIRGSAVNQDGRSNGITAPNGVAQAALIWAALRDAGIGPEEVTCVEAHGTGTRLGDPIEFGALKAALGQGDRPCAVGAVKTNIGHLESAAGMAGLIKMVLALHHDTIPAHLHLRQLNPDVVLAGSRFVIPTEPMPWPEGRRVAGVSSFGFGGTNAHVLLSGTPTAAEQPTVQSERPLHLLTLSARSETALRRLAERHRDWVAEHSDASLADVCFTAALGRSHFAHRLAVSAATSADLLKALSDWTTDKASAVRTGRVAGPTSRGVAFLFTGQGTRTSGAGRELHATCPAFRTAFDRCARILEGRLDRPLHAILEAGEEPGVGALAQAGLFALEYALAETWRSWGVEPSAVLGHSLGEYVAACVAGVFSLEDGLLLVAERGRIMEELCPEGAMAAVFAAEETVQQAIETSGAEVAVAARNGPECVVVAGSPTAVSALRTVLRDRDVASRSLPVKRAFHSPLIEPALDALEEAAARVRFSAPRLPLISNLTGAQAGPEVQKPDYWRRHARATVRFTEGVRALVATRIGTFLEIGPEPTLSKLGPACQPDGVATWLPSLRPGAGDWQTMLEALAGLYLRGARIDWAAFDREHPRQRLSLPTYPFERERYWVEPPVPAAVPLPIAAPEPTEFPVTESLYRLTWVPRSRLESAHSVVSADDLLSPLAVAERMRPVTAALHAEFGTVPPTNLARGSDVLAAGYVVRALQGLGWELRLGDRGTLEELAERLGVIAQHRRLLGRLLEILAEDGWVTLHADTWEVVYIPDIEDPENRLRELRGAYPAFDPELTLLERCGSRLAEVLRGKVDPLHLLFPGGDTTALERIYRDSPLARFANAVLATAIAAAAVDLAPGRVLRVLELGAGTGGATASILPALPADRTEYVFTDVSALFFPRARSQFRAYPFVQYQTLDLERPLEQQGFAPGQFDVVVAANVLHATADLRRSLEAATELLAPGGMLVLLEAAGPRRMLDLIFGLTEGWWKFADRDLRPNYPLLSARRWLDLFAETGLAEAAVVAASSGSETSADQVVLLARRGKPDAPARDRIPLAGQVEPGVWVVLADRGRVGTSLAASLAAAGQRAVVVEAGDEFRRLDESHYCIRPERREDLPQLLESVGVCRGIVHLWGLDADDLRSALPRGCGSLLRLLHSTGSQVGRIWLATCGAHNPQSPALVPAALWGVGRAAREEHPRLAVTLLDLDPTAPMDENAARITTELLRPDDEPEIVFAGGRRVARLVRVPAGPTPTPLPFRTDGVYVVIGSGGPEVELARALVGRGACKVRLVGPHPTLQVNGSTPHPEDAAITRHRVALAEAEEFRAALDAVAREDGPVHGIVCLAEGLREDLARQDGDRLAASLSPSLTAAEVVEQFAGVVQAEFVLFLSPTPPLAALARGRATAAAAAAAFDIVAARCPGAISLTWVEGVPAGDLLRSLEALRGRVTGATLLPAVGATLTRANPAALQSPVLAWLREELAAVPASQTDSAVEDVRSAPPARRRAVLEKLWREQVGQVLALQPAQVDLDVPLYALGLDSLMAIQLKNRVEARLGVVLPLGTLLAGGTSSQVLERVRTALEEETPAIVAEPAALPEEQTESVASSRSEPLLAAVEQMSEEDLDAVLRQLLSDAD